MANCAQMQPTLLEMAASVTMTNDNGDIYPNVVYVTGGTEESAITCGMNITDLEAFIVANWFTVDANGKPALKLRSPA
jgi:hypothetical protein